MTVSRAEGSEPLTVVSMSRCDDAITAGRLAQPKMRQSTRGRVVASSPTEIGRKVADEPWAAVPRSDQRFAV